MGSLLNTLGNRLRAELADTGKSFVFTVISDGTATRYDLNRHPVDSESITVHATYHNVTTDITDQAGVEEQTGMLILDSAFPVGTVITITGINYRYFTTDEIHAYVSDAFFQHSHNSTDAGGNSIGFNALPSVEEYPVVILASTLALYTLATDASFDIDITAPDGVHIPRSERYRQLTDMISQRKEQYKELCSLLGIGMYKTDIFTLRRISRTTGRLVPVYKPQEIDDWNFAQRVRLPVPSYGAMEIGSTALTQDLYLIAGDDYLVQFKFNFDVTSLTPLAQIRRLPTSPNNNQVGTQIYATFVPSLVDPNTIQLTLASSVTRTLPDWAEYDLQLTDTFGKVHTYARGRVYAQPEVSK